MTDLITAQTNAPNPESPVFAPRLDRGFVGAGVAIGAVYCAIIVAVGQLISKEAAGVAGAALTTVVVALLREFERLRFRTVAEKDGVEVALPQLNIWYLFLTAAAIAGLVHSLELFSGQIFARFGPKAAPGTPHDEALNILVSSWSFWIMESVIYVTGYFVGGLFCGRMAPGKRYTYAVLATLLNLGFNVILIILPAALFDFSLVPRAIKTALWPVGVAWLAVIVVALCGSLVGFRLRDRAEAMSQTAGVSDRLNAV